MSLSLLDPYSSGRIDLRNRVVQGATVTNLGRNDEISATQVEFYAERARGGVGLVVTEGLAVHPSSIPTHTVPLAFDEGLVPGFARLADAVHAEGAALVGQLWHAGRQALWNPMQLPWSASSERDPYSGSTPHAMTSNEIDELVVAFGRSALNLRSAGFEGVELHGAHGYLLTQFLSPWSNRRTDEYGGSNANRARLVARLVAEIRDVCGPDFLVGLKISADEGVPGGIDIAMAQQLVEHLVAASAPDYVAVSQGNFSPSLEWHTPDMRFRDGHFRELWRGVRDVADGVPVMAIGKIPNLEHAQAVLDAGDADLIAMTRALLADPHLVTKTSQGQTPRPCVYCNMCWHQIHTLRPVGCFYAPDTPESPVAATSGGKLAPGESADVRVVGAGLAGLEFARTAAIRGHFVRVYEAAATPGGGLSAEATIEGREAMSAATDWLVAELSGLGVDIEVDIRVDPASIATWPADAIVVQANGAVASLQPLEGVDRVLSLSDAGGNPESVIGPVAVIDEVDDEPVYAACEALARAGRDVLLITRRPAIGRHVPWVNLLGIFRRLDEVGVQVHTMAVPVRVDDEVLVMKHSFSGREYELPGVRAIVRAGPSAPAMPLEVGGRRLIRIGDALSPRGPQAVALEAHQAALQLSQ